MATTVLGPAEAECYVFRELRAQERGVPRAHEKPLVDERLQHPAAEHRVEAPQTRGLRFRQLQPGHFQELGLGAAQRRRKGVVTPRFTRARATSPTPAESPRATGGRP